jgi:hypothetical protein
MAGNPIIELLALGLGQRRYFRFQAFLQQIKQFDFFYNGEAAYLIAQIVRRRIQHNTN